LLFLASHGKLHFHYSIRTISIYWNCNLALRLWGIKQNKYIIHWSTSIRFLLYYRAKPRRQIRISIYWIRRGDYSLMWESSEHNEAMKKSHLEDTRRNVYTQDGGLNTSNIKVLFTINEWYVNGVHKFDSAVIFFFLLCSFFLSYPLTLFSFTFSQVWRIICLHCDLFLLLIAQNGLALFHSDSALLQTSSIQI